MSARAVMNETMAKIVDRAFLDAKGQPLPDYLADEALVRIIETAIRLQIMTRRRLGLGGWHVGKNRSGKMRAELLEHVAGGRFLEAIRCAAQLQARAHLYGPDA